MQATPLLDGPMLTAYREVKEVLTSPAFEQAAKEESRDFVGHTVLTLNGDEHFARRRLLSRLMRRSTLEAFEANVLDPTIARCIAACAVNRGADGVARADLVRLARTVFLQLAASTIGLDDVDTQASADELSSFLYPLIDGTTVEWATEDHAAVLGAGLRAKQAFIDRFVEPAWQRRRALVRDALHGPQSALPLDLLTLITLHAPDVSAEHVHREAVLFLVASTLNNAATVTHVIDDMTGWLREHPEDRPRLADDPFLQRIVDEVLRFRRVTPALIRRALEPVVLSSSGRIVERGEVLLMDIGQANRDPDTWGADADRFNPARSVPVGEKAYGLAFGSGVHVCLGRPLVLGSYTDQSGAGMLVRFLRSLYQAGVATDPDAAGTKAASEQTRFDTYPVMFEAL